MNIGFIGNFSVPYSTECERRYSFEQLGHTVVPFQENKTTAKELIVRRDELDMLMYSHTHDRAYIIADLIKVFENYRKVGIPTVSAHLDRWAWLRRVSDVGKEATWFTEHIFMADASPEAVELYEKYKLNWHWLKPGVVAHACNVVPPDYQKYPHEVIFVGSRGYHPEYPERPQLIDWLKTTYGSRFGHYGNDGLGVVRESALNTLYASSKVVVGDSCFAGRTSNYWSDRIPETTGRGGFLLHPHSPGCDHQGVTFYDPKQLDDLKTIIDYFLQADEVREADRKVGFEWTKNNRTYTHLATEILATVCK